MLKCAKNHNWHMQIEEHNDKKILTLRFDTYLVEMLQFMKDQKCESS